MAAAPPTRDGLMQFFEDVVKEEKKKALHDAGHQVLQLTDENKALKTKAAEADQLLTAAQGEVQTLQTDKKVCQAALDTATAQLRSKTSELEKLANQHHLLMAELRAWFTGGLSLVKKLSRGYAASSPRSSPAASASSSPLLAAILSSPGGSLSSQSVLPLPNVVVRPPPVILPLPRALQPSPPAQEDAAQEAKAKETKKRRSSAAPISRRQSKRMKQGPGP